MKTLQEVENWLKENEMERSIYFKEPCYAEAIVGYDYHTQAIIYDYDKMAESLMEHYPEEYSDISEAYSFIDDNISYGYDCPYEGEPPIILIRNQEGE